MAFRAAYEQEDNNTRQTVLGQSEQVLLNTDKAKTAQDAADNLIQDTRDNAKTLKPSEIVDRSKLILSFVISGIYSKDKSKSQTLSEYELDYSNHFKQGYQNANVNNQATAMYLKFLDQLKTTCTPTKPEEMVYIQKANQQVALMALEDYAEDPMTPSVLNNATELLATGGHLSQSEFLRVIDAYTGIIQNSSNLKDVELASEALQELKYGAFEGSHEYAKERLEELLVSGDLSPKAQTIVDNNRVLGSPYDRKLKRVNTSISQLLMRKGDLEKTKLNIDNMIDYLRQNLPFATNKNFRDGQSPAQVVYNSLSEASSLLKKNLKLNEAEREFVNSYLPEKMDELRNMDRSISEGPTPTEGELEDLNILLDSDSVEDEDAVDPDDLEVVTEEEKENLTRRATLDDFFWKPQNREDEISESSKMVVSKSSTYIPDFPFSETEVQSAIKAFEDGVNALIISNEREMTAVQNTELIASIPALRAVFEYTINNEFSSAYLPGTDKQQLIDDFNRGYWDKIYDQMTVGNRFKGLQAIGGVKSQRMEQKIGLYALPFSLQLKPQNKELGVQMLKAARSGEGGIFCAYAFPGTSGIIGESGFGVGMTVSGLLSSNEGEKVTNYQNYFSEDMRAELRKTLESDPGVNGKTLSASQRQEIYSLAQVESVNVIQLNKVCGIMGYTYMNGNISPTAEPKVSFSTATEVLGLFQKAFGGYREIEQVGGGSPKLSMHALIDSPWYFIIPPKGILKDMDASLRTLLFRPYIAIGQFPYMKKNEGDVSKNLIDLDRGFGVTETGFRLGWGNDIGSSISDEITSTSVLDADVVADISWKKTIDGNLGKPNYDVRAASPSFNLFGTDFKGFYRGLFGGELGEDTHSIGVFFFPDAMWGADAPWLHLAGNISIDPVRGEVAGWQMHNSYDITDNANLLLRLDWNKFMKDDDWGGPAIRLGLNYKFK